MNSNPLDYQLWLIDARLGRLEQALGLAPLIVGVPQSAAPKSPAEEPPKLAALRRIAGRDGPPPSMPAMVPDERGYIQMDLPLATPPVATPPVATPPLATPELEVPVADVATNAADSPLDAGRSSLVEPPLAMPHPPMPPPIHVAKPPPLPPLPTAKLPAAKLPYRSPPNPPAIPTKKHGAIEQAIGLKWAGWVGAIILVIGVGLGVQYAYQQHWFASIPNGLLLSLIMLAGFALIGAGEWVYRKVNVISAASLFGAGVATLFVASYSGFAYYKIYSPTTAFALMGFSTLIGAGVAMRGRLVSIGALALIGGFITPLLVSTGHPQLAPFLSYLLALQLVALALAWWGASPRWWTLRGLALSFQAIWLLVVFDGHAFPEPSFAIVQAFVLIYWALYEAELIISALRSGKPLVQVGVPFSLVATTLAVSATVYMTADSGRDVRTIWVLTFAAVCGATALVLQQKRNGPTYSLAIGFAIQAVGLLAVAVPVALAGNSVVLGWGVLAAGLAVVGAVLDLKTSRTAAFVTWSLAVADLLRRAVDPSDQAAIDAAWFHLFGEPITAGLMLAGFLAIAGQAISHLTLVRRATAALANQPALSSAPTIQMSYTANPWTGICWSMATAASAVWVIAAIAFLSPAGATLAIVAGAWALAVFDLSTRRLSPAFQAAILLAVAATKWAVIDTLAWWTTPAARLTNYLPVFNPSMAVGALVVASMVGLYFFRRTSLVNSLRPGTDASAVSASFAFALASLVVAMLTLGLTVEIDRAVTRAVATGQVFTWEPAQVTQMGWTILWSIASCIFALLAVKIARATQRPTIWLKSLWWLTAIPALKYVLYDSFLGGTATQAIPVLNLRILTGVVVAAAAVFIAMISADRRESQSNAALDSGGNSLGLFSHWLMRLPIHVAVAAMFVLVWAGSVEISRCVDRFAAAGGLRWPVDELRLLLFTTWWTTAAAGMFTLAPSLGTGVWTPRTPRRVFAWLLILLVFKYLLIDTFLARITGQAVLAMPLANPQAVAGAFLLAAMLLIRLSRPVDAVSPNVRGTSSFLCVLILLWVGTLEIDRLFAGLVPGGSIANPQLAKQVAISVFWSIFAVASVIAGFKWVAASLRYFGLSLFAITLLKVVFVDLAELRQGYRILSFLGLGLLLLGTSVLYGKLSPRFLNEPKREKPPGI